MKYIAYSLFLLSLFTLLAFFFFLIPTSFSDTQIRFVIPIDMKQEQIAQKLKSEHFIRSERVFRIIVTFLGFPGTIEPGAYLLSRRMNIFTLSDTLLHKPFQKWLTVTPGNRNEQIAEKLTNTFRWDDQKVQEFLNNAEEGFMFPETYLIPVADSPKDVAKRMITTFNERFGEQMFADMTAQNIRLITAVRIASLIERESGRDEDKKLIAGIIWNRLLKGMKLQIDAAAQYYTGSTGNWWPIVKPEDLRVDNPYNTYKIDGLPPTPICNPSLASLQATVYPDETDCFYYLHDANKQIHCARTFEEHKENIKKYL